jgi:hypothetical protein
MNNLQKAIYEYKHIPADLAKLSKKHPGGFILEGYDGKYVNTGTAKKQDGGNKTLLKKVPNYFEPKQKELKTILSKYKNKKNIS